MKVEKKHGASRAWLCRGGSSLKERTRLMEAGYPRFLFRLAASRRAWAMAPAGPKRHD